MAYVGRSRPRLHRTQYRFDNFAFVHFFESRMPFGNRPDTADDGLNIQCATGHQCDHTFPNWPVMTKAPLQGHVLLDKRIEVKVKG